MKKLFRFWKWGLLILYLLMGLLAWNNRSVIFGYFHIPEDFFLYTILQIAFDIILLSLAVTGAIGLIWFARASVIMRIRFYWAAKRAGLWNAQQERPLLISTAPDPNKSHGIICKVNGKGLAPCDFLQKAERLGTSIGGEIYAVEHAKKHSHIRIYFLPRKYTVPFTLGINRATAEKLLSIPNLLTVGATGTGKSYALLTILGVYAEYLADVSITVCDYKKSSFSQFEGTPNFYGYERVTEGIRAFYQEFLGRLEANDPERNKQIRVLLIDEYGALISAQDKKAAEELKTMVANMVFMGRSLGCRVLIGVQRADAEHFKAGARDQFKAILGLGNLSAEQKQMLFRDHKDRMTDRNGIGEGYLLIDGQDIERVKVAKIQNEASLTAKISNAMSR